MIGITFFIKTRGKGIIYNNSFLNKKRDNVPFLERKTRFELATYSLEGYSSTN
jgi:hypothetical protein